MGVWGASSFENDSALDWVTEISNVGDIVAKFNALAELDEATPPDQEVSIGVELASEIIAAAEVVALLMSQIAPDTPEDLRNKLTEFGKPDTALIEQAKMSVSEVLGDSELLDLWSENASDRESWNLAITGLIERLNADVTDIPPSAEDIADVGGNLSPCVFCGKDIEPKQLTRLSLRDMSSKDSMIIERGMYCHFSCINSKLHPRHLIQNWKFNVDDALVDRILGNQTD